MTKLFGTDGIRGKANQYPITPEIALWTGKAIAKIFKESGRSRPRAIIGKDTRLSGYMLETALTSGLVSMGMDVFEIGPMPTPAVAHLTRSMCADCGIMITASHNPASDNGIKIFDRAGYKLPDEVEARIEKEVCRMIADHTVAGPEEIGKAFRIDDARGRYIEFAKSSIKNHSLDGMRVVLDCANGAAYYIAPLILKELGVELIRTATSPDGSNINENCGATHPQNMVRLVKEYGADAGISLDGDADRVIFADHLGNIVNGDRIIGLCALDYKARNRLSNNTIAVTCMSNLGLTEAMTRAGIRTEVTPVGDRYVIERMRDLDLNLGGEQSGHLIFHDYATTGDGIISALHVLRLMKRKNATLNELAGSFMTEFPQLLTNIPVQEKVPLEELPGVIRTVEDARAALGSAGKIMVRYSGTENKLRVLVEARSRELAEKWHGHICSAVRKAVEK
ncbi:MAG: phosphoglucosamine mutase [Lentisphaeria bacterium]|nr:phosphoglucosamine mutase [Lentisphaeria bacterium]